jgi:hypothetical protein
MEISLLKVVYQKQCNVFMVHCETPKSLSQQSTNPQSKSNELWSSVSYGFKMQFLSLYMLSCHLFSPSVLDEKVTLLYFYIYIIMLFLSVLSVFIQECAITL